MKVNLAAMAKTIQTEADFLRFAEALLADWEDEQKQLEANLQLQRHSSPGPNRWENGDIGGFLSAVIRWTRDIDHTQRYDAVPDWSLFAFMLLAGKEYE